MADGPSSNGKRKGLSNVLHIATGRQPSTVRLTMGRERNNFSIYALACKPLFGKVIFSSVLFPSAKGSQLD